MVRTEKRVRSFGKMVSCAPGHSTAVVGINDRGQVLGTIDMYIPFFWENGASQIISDGNLYARALGPNGEVIGFARGGGVVWQNGRLTVLGEGDPQAINSRGEIVGFSGWNSFTRATLWRRKR